MIELPEAAFISKQLNETVSGKNILDVIAAQSPHKFAWYSGDPQKYKEMLKDKTIGKAEGFGGLIEIGADDMTLLFGDGVSLIYHDKNEKRPEKHQLLMEFCDGTALSASVHMYGGIWCFKTGEFNNEYYLKAKKSISPISNGFDRSYFENIISASENIKLSLKALLATEQRIPGLGNGVLQDILYNADLHPKRKTMTLSEEDKDMLFRSIKTTLSEMILMGGRDTEKDLFGDPGGYITKLSRNTTGKPCPICSSVIVKEQYMGGSVYFCTACQK